MCRKLRQEEEQETGGEGKTDSAPAETKDQKDTTDPKPEEKKIVSLFWVWL